MKSPLLQSFANRYRLTSREAEILELLALSGAKQERIAKRLYIEVKTLKNHIANIHDKTCCRSTIELLSKVITFMLLEQEANQREAVKHHALI